MESGSKRLKIAMIAPPWLNMYPRCFFGIENMVHYLTESLTELGHQVELFTVGHTETKAAKLHWYHKENQYQHIHKPYYLTSSIIISHILYALNFIRKSGDFDIIHDHNNFLGPAMMAYSEDILPPVLHTLHEPFTDKKLVAKGIPDNRLMFAQLKSIQNLYFNSVSFRQLQDAPRGFKERVLSVIYNGINPNDYDFLAEKQDFYLNVGSIKKDKGQAVAARLCVELNAKLKIAGIIAGGITTPKQLILEIANPSSKFRNSADFKYYVSAVLPQLIPGQIEYIGAIQGKEKLELFSQAKALLVPIEWEEPFGIVAIEALASGTPVVAFSRGAMPEIIEHGKNGFLAETEKEFKHYMKKVDQIDPKFCRASVEKKFSSSLMAEEYLKLYKKIIRKTST